MDPIGPAPRQKLYHRAALIGPNGEVSALCFRTPRAIDLKKATWTNRDEAVTCPRCKAAIEHGREADEIAPEESAKLDAILSGVDRRGNAVTLKLASDGSGTLSSERDGVTHGKAAKL